MPKKRTFNNLNKFTGSSSSSGKQAAGSNGASSSPSVNERLSELRKLEGKDAAKKKAELAEQSSSLQRSVPPELRNILGVPDTAPPKPKRGVRTRMPNRTPGPAPPASWTKTPGWTRMLALRTGQRRFRRTTSTDIDRNRPQQLMRFARMTKYREVDDRKPSSLLHLACKSAAEHWHLFDEEDLPALADLPLSLRQCLISYIAFYGPTISTQVLDALTCGNEPVTYLDLAGLAGHAPLSMSRLTKLAKQQTTVDDAVNSGSIAESWDIDESFEAALLPSLSTTRFASLTHLSLSHPPPSVSWKDLLALSKHIPSITHLSLAYWPRPTLTPNLATTTVSSQHSPDVSAGASHFYSALDRDLYEPNTILRTLSGNLLRLAWLDLEGCAEWVPALAFQHKVTASEHTIMNDSWTGSTAGNVVASICVHNWKNLAFLYCSQGWSPHLSTLKALLPRITLQTQREVIARFEKVQSPDAPHSIEGEDHLDLISQRKAETWLLIEERTYLAERQINTVRKSHNVRVIDFDHGWSRQP